MKLYVASIEIICGEYGFCDNYLLVAKNIKEAEKKVKDYIKEENQGYPRETFYTLGGLKEFNFLNEYKINYNLRKLKKTYAKNRNS